MVVVACSLLISTTAMEQETDLSPFVVKTVERKYYLTLLAHKTEWVNRTKNVRFYPSSCTGKERDVHNPLQTHSDSGGSQRVEKA